MVTAVVVVDKAIAVLYLQKGWRSAGLPEEKPGIAAWSKQHSADKFLSVCGQTSSPGGAKLRQGKPRPNRLTLTRASVAFSEHDPPGRIDHPSRTDLRPPLRASSPTPQPKERRGPQKRGV